MNLAKVMKKKYYKSQKHPFRIFENKVKKYLKKDDCVLDAGCGRKIGFLKTIRLYASKRTIGVDLVDVKSSLLKDYDIEYYKSDLANIPINDGSVDIVVSKSVVEHFNDPLPIYHELYRVMRPNSFFIFLTPNKYDYVSMFAVILPDFIHPFLVSYLTERSEQDTFPTYFKSNSYQSITRLAKLSNFKVVSIEYLNQDPHYFQRFPLLYFYAIGYERITSKIDSFKYLRGWILAVLKKD